MTVKQYLQTYKQLERCYDTVVEEIRTIENKVICLRSPSFEERVQASPKKDPIGEMVCSLEKEKGKLGMRLTEYRGKMLVIKNQLAEIEKVDADFYTILFFRYILYENWVDICNRLSLSRSQANVIHGKALLEFDAKFNEFYRKK